MLADDRKKVEEWTKAVSADYGVTSLREALAVIVAEAGGAGAPAVLEQATAERAA
jgi:hypothetical protein